MRDPSDTHARYAPIALLGFFLLTFAATWTAWLAPAATGTARYFGVGGPVFLEDRRQSAARDANARFREQHDRHRSSRAAQRSERHVVQWFTRGLGDSRTVMGVRRAAPHSNAWGRDRRTTSSHVTNE